MTVFQISMMVFPLLQVYPQYLLWDRCQC